MAEQLQDFTLDQWRDLYVVKGFTWNVELESFVREWADKLVDFSHCNGKVAASAHFCVSKNIDCIHWLHVAHHLKEGVAPVGSCHGGEIDLLLTASGQLIGVRDGMLFRWGPADAHWKTSLQFMFAGVEVEHFRTVPLPD